MRFKVCVRFPGFAAAVICLMFGVIRTEAAEPIVPLTSVHHYWDHHWYVWLPRHPKYEAAEIMSIDTPGNPYKAVWVFLTERGGHKRQVHYFNDPAIVENVQGSYFREIDYQRTGKQGYGQNVQVSLTDVEKKPIRIRIDADRHKLTEQGAGLTDQSGHSADKHVLLFYRSKSALATHNFVHIDGIDYSFRLGDDTDARYSFRAAYSQGIQIVLFPFGRWQFSRNGEQLRNETMGLVYTTQRHEQITELNAQLSGYRNQIKIALDTDGTLKNYRHNSGTHRMLLSTKEPVPLAEEAPPMENLFSIRLDPVAPLAEGIVTSEPIQNGRRLVWQFLTPDWASRYSFESAIQYKENGFALNVQSFEPN